jgi:propanol-preferring alcohol dehydrogenase
MKAWVLEQQSPIEERPLKLMEVSTPHPQGNEVRIKVLVCGICRTDIHIAEGDLPLKKVPVVPGHEVVGVVDEVGEGVRWFSVGDRAGVYWLHGACGKCKYCLSQRENYCPDFRATGWHEDGGYAEYITISETYTLSLNKVRLEPAEIAPLMCPGIAGFAAFKLTEVQEGDRFGLYGYGPTASVALKVAQSLGVETYVSTRSQKNITRARQEGATWAADASKEEMPYPLDAAILFPPAGHLVEPALSQLVRDGTLVMAPVSSSPIDIKNYSKNLWGRTIKTLYNVSRADAEEFFGMVDELGLQVGTSLFAFEQLQDALILAKHGKLDQPNAVIRVAD